MPYLDYTPEPGTPLGVELTNGDCFSGAVIRWGEQVLWLSHPRNCPCGDRPGPTPVTIDHIVAVYVSFEESL